MNSSWGKSSYSVGNGACLEARWRKSSRSTFNGNCLEARWQKSSFSFANGNCVEARQHGEVQVRDSQLGDGSPVLAFPPAAWQAFVDGLKV